MYCVVFVAIQMCVAVYFHANIIVQLLSKKKMKHKTYTSDVAEFTMVMEVLALAV